MRAAIVTDIHGNLTAFEAVLADLGKTAPDVIFHGGDLPHGGSRPAEIVDRIRSLGRLGVLGNTDEMLFDPASLNDFSRGLPHLQSMFAAIEEMAAFTREALGDSRLEWLRGLPRAIIEGEIALVHASPGSTWRAPSPEASDAELEAVYAPLGRPVAVYGHIHRPFIRNLGGLTVMNTGSVSLSYDGDPRAAYLLLDGGRPAIRRVEYDLAREQRALAGCGMPHSDWVSRGLAEARPSLP